LDEKTKFTILDEIWAKNGQLIADKLSNSLHRYISLYRLGNQYIFVHLQIKYLVHLQIKYLSIAGLNLDEILDEIGDFGRTKNDIWDNIFLVSLVISL